MPLGLTEGVDLTRLISTHPVSRPGLDSPRPNQGGEPFRLIINNTKEMKNRKVHNPDRSKDFRKYLRSRMTPAETYLWGFLKSGQLEGRKFRRQHGIGRYVVDFYCASEYLIIELDGQVHFGSDDIANYEEESTAYFETPGMRVLRYENKYVFYYPTWVMEEIKENFRKD